MKNIIFVISFLLIACASNAQQDILVTQFQYDKLAFNPAYAGNYDHTSLTAIYRNQWIGLDGAPARFAASANLASIQDRLGIGIQFDNSSVSIFKRNTLKTSFAYAIPLDHGTLSAGLSTSLRQFSANFDDPRLNPQDGWDDESISQMRFTQTIFNVGVGLYYRSPTYFFGISIPGIARTEIDLEENDDLISREVRNIYFMAGGKWTVNESWELSPQVLVVTAENNPLDIELGLTGILAEQYHIGMNLSVDQSTFLESIDLLLAWQYNESILAGLSYDINLSQLRNFSSGSIELALNYRIGNKPNPESVINPRYF